MKKLTASQLAYQIKRNLQAEMRLEESYDLSPKEIRKKKELAAKQEEMIEEFKALVGMDDVPSEESEKLRDRMRELGISEDLILGTAWICGDGWA